jgi:hypothetical protein
MVHFKSGSRMHSLSNSGHIYCDFGPLFTLAICNARQFKVTYNLLAFVYLHMQTSNVTDWYRSLVRGQRVLSVVIDCGGAVTSAVVRTS